MRPASEPLRSGRAWNLSGWAFARRGSGAALAAGGALGGSQAGARLGIRLHGTPARPLAAFARIASALDDRSTAEAALGLEWRPLKRLPVALALERRLKLGSGASSAFAGGVAAGFSDARLAGLRIDAYGQAGVVGLRSRDLFVDGAVRAGVPLDRTGRLRIGAGVWAAAQPGAARADVGPHASLRIRVAGGTATLAADWRFRVAGRAGPGSGPALTLATDF